MKCWVGVVAIGLGVALSVPASAAAQEELSTSKIYLGGATVSNPSSANVSIGSGTFTAGTFSGSCASCTSIPAGNLTGSIAYPRMPSGSGTWSASPTIGGTLTTAGNVLPSMPDTYDLGSATNWWRQGYISQMNAVLFAKETQTLYGGWLSVAKNAGTFPHQVLYTDTEVDFGQAMTLNQFVVVRAIDSGGTPAVEYFKVGALFSGTTYTVTRNLSGVGSRTWSEGTPYQVRGVAGDGWLELNAFDTPRLSVFTQGAAYNNSVENLRIGHLAGMPNSVTGIGFYVGTSTAHLYYSPTDGFNLVSAGATLDGTGLTLSTGNSAYSASGAVKFTRPSAALFGQTGDINALHADAFSADTYLALDNTIKGLGTGAGGSAGKATVYLNATGWNNSGSGSATPAALLEVHSEIGLSRVRGFADNYAFFDSAGSSPLMNLTSSAMVLPGTFSIYRNDSLSASNLRFYGDSTLAIVRYGTGGSFIVQDSGGTNRFQFSGTGTFNIPALAGGGARLVCVDNSGNFYAAAGSC